MASGSLLTGWQKSQVDVKHEVSACSSLACRRKLRRSRPTSSKCNVAVNPRKIPSGCAKDGHAGVWVCDSSKSTEVEWRSDRSNFLNSTGRWC